MDSREINATWKKVCEEIKKYDNIDPVQVDAFFSRLHPQVMSTGFLMLTTDNAFIKTWVEKTYGNYIKQVLQDIYKMQYRVVIEVDGENSEKILFGAGNPLEISDNPSKKMLSNATDTSTTSTTSTDKTARSNTTKENESHTNTTQTTSLPLPIQEEPKPISTLTFESFVIGDSNKMAYSMAVEVAEMPGKTHLNPLFIYGKSGLGKTHLLRAIQNYIGDSLPHLKTVYVDSAEFVNSFTEASAEHDKDKSSFKKFKTPYEQADVLLIDDVQFFQGKKLTLDIVFQLFNALTSEGKQIILSADRAPKNIDIENRYQTRFNSGMTVDIQPPEIETKLGIIKSFVEEYKKSENNSSLSIPEEAQFYIAENSSSNIRELKSAVTKTLYHIMLSQKESISADEVRELLENHFSGGFSKRLNILDIQKEVESFYRISHNDLVGKSRKKDISHARQMCMYLCRQLLDIPFATIGKKFGGRDHSTVMYSITNIEADLKHNRNMMEEIEALKQIIKEVQ